MPTVWLSLRKSLQCRPEDQDVHHPESITVVMAKGELNPSSEVFARKKFIKRVDRFNRHRSRTSDEFSKISSQEVMLIGDYKCQCYVKSTGLLEESKITCVCANNSRRIGLNFLFITPDFLIRRANTFPEHLGAEICKVAFPRWQSLHHLGIRFNICGSMETCPQQRHLS